MLAKKKVYKIKISNSDVINDKSDPLVTPLDLHHSSLEWIVIVLVTNYKTHFQNAPQP